MANDEPVLERRGRFTIVRDDLLEGGSKTRFLPYLIEGAEEVVFGGPFCGGAPWALSVLCRDTGKRCTLFYAARRDLHWRQQSAIANGAKLHFVSPGYMTNIQKKARDYAQAAGALFLPLGFDVPAAERPFIAEMERVRRRVGEPDQVWCATGSGMLARCLAQAFPNSEVHGVCVGLASRHDAQSYPKNVLLRPCPYKFEQMTKAHCPFPSDRNYDRKAWEQCVEHSRGNVLMWNVSC